MKKLITSLFALAVMTTASAQMSSTAQARVYAYDLKQAGDDVKTVTFKTNTKANTAVVTLSAEGQVDIMFNATSTDGKNWSVEITPSKAFGADVEYNWSVEVSADAVTEFKEIADKTKDVFTFNRSHCIAVDNSPESNNFGRVYVVNQKAGGANSSYAAKPRQTELGFYTFTPELLPENNAKNYQCDVIGRGETSTGYSPNDMAIMADGKILLSDVSDNYGGLYVVDPYNNFISEDTNIDSKIAGIGTTGEGEDELVYAIDWTNSGAVNCYSVNEWTSPMSTFVNFPTIANNIEYNVAISNVYNSIEPVTGGFWVCQYNGSTSSASKLKNSALFYCNSEGELKWAIEKNSLNSKWSVVSRNGALAVNEGLGLVAFTLVENSKVNAYVFKYTIKTNGNVGTEFVGAYEMTTQGNRSNALDFDYAGNLYAVTSGTECMSVYAIPTDNNTCTTPAKKSLTIAYSKELIDIVTGIVSIESENAPVEYYNLQGVKVENPENGIFIKKQGRKTTKVIL